MEIGPAFRVVRIAHEPENLLVERLGALEIGREDADEIGALDFLLRHVERLARRVAVMEQEPVAVGIAEAGAMQTPES